MTILIRNRLSENWSKKEKHETTGGSKSALNVDVAALLPPIDPSLLLTPTPIGMIPISPNQSQRIAHHKRPSMDDVDLEDESESGSESYHSADTLTDNVSRNMDMGDIDKMLATISKLAKGMQGYRGAK
jgi:hypothetical protein